MALRSAVSRLLLPVTAARAQGTAVAASTGIIVYIGIKYYTVTVNSKIELPATVQRTLIKFPEVDICCLLICIK